MENGYTTDPNVNIKFKPYIYWQRFGLSQRARGTEFGKCDCEII